jgi:kinesin family member 15
MNEKSSRSHSVLTTIIESKTMNVSGVWQMKSARFHIIDLAGSERAKHTNAEGQRLKEAGMINKSLSTLGLVINSLVEKSEGKTRHVHYRNSKLTFLLRDSLGGNSKTVIIANITQAQSSLNETLSTL